MKYIIIYKLKDYIVFVFKKTIKIEKDKEVFINYITIKDYPYKNG
jgi:hypothetical protein